MSDAEIGSTYRSLVATKHELRTLEEEGKALIDDLHWLAKCFEPDEKNVVISEVNNEELTIWKAGGWHTIKRPFEVERIAARIAVLKKERDKLREQLDSLVNPT